ncbi:MAG: hypothetical protein CVV28_11885 [Methanobacteriales archaeon HGW-Methanobacteriales-1]|jgi:glycosyltransferase involved in cell wall biosynthesis|nr:MAG: hypothetical protein CVV28_11885 [Methanobacteriales archaeon HGW-Methanobacteriales-1]
MSYKISVIVPIFNVERYITEALDSIIHQTIGINNIEVIMVDDCSTDNSPNIIDDYASKYDNFKAIHLPENSHFAGKPRNVGINNSNGNYLMFLDPDDYFVDDACEVLYDLILKEDNDLSFGIYGKLVNNTKIKVNFDDRGFKNTDTVKISDICENSNLLRIPPAIASKIFKATFIKENNIFFPEGIPGQDLVFVINSLLKAKKISFLNNYVVYYYRTRNTKGDKSVSFNRNKSYLSGLINAYMLSLKLLKDFNNEKYLPNIFDGHIGYWINQLLSSNLNKNELKELFKESELMFEECKKGNVNPKYLKSIPLFNSLIEKRYDEAILLIENNKLKKRLKSKNKQIAILKTSKGWFKYKSKNIYLRLKVKMVGQDYE